MSARRNFSPPSDDRDEYICPICLEFAFEPLYLKPCGHFICKNCHHKLREGKPSINCPVCRGGIEKSFPFKEMELRISQLKEKCPGCQEMIALPNMKQHVLKCPTLSKFETYSNQMIERSSRPWKSAAQNGSRGQGFRIAKQRQESHYEREDRGEFTPRQRRNFDQDHCSDEENFDEFSSQDYQHRRHFKPQRPAFSPEANNDIRCPQFIGRGRRRGSRNRNGRCGPQHFPHFRQNQNRKKDVHPWTPEPSMSKVEDSDDETESTGGASQMTAMGVRQMHSYFDPSQGAIPKYLPNLERSNPKRAPPRNPSMPTVSGASTSPENASAASSIPSGSPNYTCPYCGEPSLSQSDLVNHCLGQHSFETRRMVCPICASMTWGNPNQTSANFIKHLQIRHSYNYKTYVPNENDDDEAMLSLALEASLQDI